MATQALLTTAEAAKRLRISTRTIARRAGSGDLPYVRKLDGIRGSYLFDAAVIDLIARQQDRRMSALTTLALGGDA